MTVPAWRIYYSDGTVYDGDRPPARDVQVILQHDEDGPYFQSGSDYYIRLGDRWQGVDIFGLFDYLLDSGLVLFGRTITRKEYDAAYQRAKVDKNTWRPGERRP
jgi:hypothetical protein